MFKRNSLAICFAFLFLTSVSAQNIDAKINDIKFALMDGNYEEGLQACQSLIESNVSDTSQLALIYAYAGMSSEALGKAGDALTYYEKAVKFEAPQLDIYEKLISLAKKEKNDSVYEFALLEKARAFPDFDEPITRSLASHYAKIQDYEKLLTTTNKLLELYPDEVKFLFYKGVALQNSGNVEEAKGLYEKILELEPEHPGANMGIGMLLYNAGSEIFAFRKKEYESKVKPDRVDYSIYNKGIEEGKVLYRKALPYLLKAYESGSYPGLKQVLFNTYARLEQKEKAEPYRQ
jgi:tetratricopeptide (TPR) repeat protein